MTGELIGQLVLWLIFAVIVVFILYWVMHWLYRRSTKEIAFVRTGFLGEKVVIDGGAFVWPIIHDITPVNMNSLQLTVKRERGDALITKDRMRIDVDAVFYVRVKQNREALSLAASTLGSRTLEPERIHTLLEGKFVSALRTVASSMTIEQLHEDRNNYVGKVLEDAQAGLDKNGLELESVSITDIDQTEIEYFNPSNKFDAEGLTTVIKAIEDRRRIRNDIEQDTMTKIRERNLEAEKQSLEIERQSEEARLEQEAGNRIPQSPAEGGACSRARRTGAGGGTGGIHIARGHRDGAHHQRTPDRPSPNRIRARYPANRNRPAESR